MPCNGVLNPPHNKNNPQKLDHPSPKMFQPPCSPGTFCVPPHAVLGLFNPLTGGKKTRKCQFITKAYYLT